MDILEVAIQTESSVGKLAEALDVAQNVVSNWRKRGVPKPWRQVLELRYGRQPVRVDIAAQCTTPQPTAQGVQHAA